MQARRFISALIVLLAMALGTAAYGQGGSTSTLSGTVTDSSGGVLPGVTITVTENATQTVFTAVTGENGSFTIPAIPSGTYTAKVSLDGFKTTMLKDIIVSVGVPTSVKTVVLEIGGIEETVVVGGATEVVQTQSTSVAQTLSAKQIANLPIPGRAAFDLVAYMPGVTSTTGSIRDATVNGLPQSSVNITLDGMNIQDNYAKTWDGMFTRVSPRLDAVEEVTIGTAAQGADMAGQGGVQVKFVTRAGTNDYRGSTYYYLRREWMNSNTWFNLHRSVDLTGKPADRPTINQKQPGIRFGGPVQIPGLYDGHDKFFFFVNYEEVRSPGTRNDTRTIMSPLSEQGIFQYGSGKTVDLLALARANGQVASIDPQIAKLMAQVRASTQQGSVNATTDPLTQSFAWSQMTASTTKFPTVRMDYNLTSKHRATFSMTRNHLISNPDTTNTQQAVFPGFASHGLQDSVRYTGQGSLRSTITTNLVNEFRFGATGGATLFSPDKNPGMWSDTNGYSIGWSAFKSISNPGISNTTSAREGKTRVFEDTLNWIKGSHAIAMGGSYTRADVWLYNQQLVPGATLGMATGDPADGLFTTANFPGASSSDLTNAKNLYAVLTGRITSLGREARIGADGQTYTILGSSNQYGRLPQFGSFIQDSWRIKQNLTINAGLRFDVQMPFRSLNNSYSMATLADLFGNTGIGAGFVPGSNVNGLGNTFKPGVSQGSPTTFKQLDKGTKAYKVDWSNVAPSIGAAWTTGGDDGFLKRLLGLKGDSVLRAGYNRAYQRGGMSDFTEIFGNNPGIAIDATRDSNTGTLGTLPVLLSSGNLAPPGISLTRVFPIAVPNANASVYVFDPNLKTPHSDSFQFGWQRALAKNMSVEARYVHTSSAGMWTLGNTIGRRNYNELNIIENNFFNEFKLAQQNLQANIAAGNGGTFAYTGAPGTVPLPTFLAFINGVGASGANTAASYTGSNWTNSTLVQSLFPLLANPFVAANQLRSNATFRSNGVKAGLPANFFVVNPDVTNAYLVTNGPDTRFNGIQFVLNRRFAGGFLIQSNYAYGRGYQQQFYSLHRPYQEMEQTWTNSFAGSGDVRHNWTTNWVYELPFGRGKRFGSNAHPALDRVIGGWSWQGVARLQSGRILDFGNVRLVGMTPDQLAKAFQVRKVTDPANQFRTLVYVLPQDIIDNTIKAFSVNASGYVNGAPTGRYIAPANGPDCMEQVQSNISGSNTGYGDCGTRSLLATGPKVVRFDMNMVKQIKVAKSVNLEFQLQVFNVFNKVNFLPVTGYSTATGYNNYANPDAFQVTSAVDQSRTMQMAFRISW
jgi:carboxypeptidase family protein/TonB-dependent receptor-like protein